ncbi:MAG: chemotaxis protein CheW [Burkholderiaceae bacterium]
MSVETGSVARAGAKAAPSERRAADDSPQYLRLTVGAEPFAVPLEAVLEILQVGSLTPLPLTPAFVRGVMNLRGAVVPVLDLNARFGRRALATSARSCIVIVEAAQRDEHDPKQPIGLFVDAVHEVVAIAEEDIEPVPTLGTSVDAGFLSGVARSRERLVPVIELSRTLDTVELARLISGFDNGCGALRPTEDNASIASKGAGESPACAEAAQ